MKAGRRIRAGLLFLGAGLFLFAPMTRADGFGSGGGVRSGGGNRAIDALGSMTAGQSSDVNGALQVGLIFTIRGITPVTLTAFSASIREQGGVTLEWRLTTDSTPAGFLVDRGASPEGPFERLTPEALPASARSFNDPAPGSSGDVWYRLTAIDRDGTTIVLGVLSVDVHAPAVPLKLHQNAPNPMTTTTTFAVDLPGPGHVALKVYDVSGRLRATVFDGVLDAGRHLLPWDGGGEYGRLSAGVYFYILEAMGKVEKRKLVMG